MDIVNNAKVVSGHDEPSTRLSASANDRATSATPTGIRSSPPTLSTHVVVGYDIEDASLQGAKSDSEAETILLHEVEGHSLSKIRKDIKLEDTPTESNLLGVMDDVDMGRNVANSERSSEGATSNLGKRKRSKHGNHGGKYEHSRNGNSSGLSSVPTSPATGVRQPLTKTVESDSDVAKSPSTGLTRSDTAKSADRGSNQDADHEAPSADEKEPRRTRRRRSSGLEAADKQEHQNNGQQTTSQATSRKPTRSTSPHLNAHRRSASSNSVANGLSQKKRKIPAPLRATKDRPAIDEHSDDDSSAGESPHPRRSRTRNLATPPTGDSSAGLTKMPPHKKKNPFGRTELANACEDGDISKAKRLLQEKPEDLDVADAAGNTPLQCASLNGHVELVKLLLNAECNIHCVNTKKDSPLLDAVENGHLEVVKLLLEAGVNPRIRNEEGAEPIDKIDEDHEDANEIRRALREARANTKWTQPPTSASAPVQSPHSESYASRSRRTQSHGRSTKTGDHQLYTSYTVNSLRLAAARGDLQTVGNILQVLVTTDFDDPESLVGAARGGHDEVLQILLGFGNADPDPPPLENRDWEHATPMLAAIGSDNIKVIELLLAKIDDHRFDPTKRYNGSSYYEIARQRRGPFWEEEERILKEAYDKYRSGSSARLSTTSQHGSSRGHHKKLSDSSTKSKAQETSGAGQGSKRDQKGATTTTIAPVKRGPGRPRKEGYEQSMLLDRESNSSAPHREKVQSKKPESDIAIAPSDTEPTKPRRKLISGKELKGEREKQRRASVASIQSSGSAIFESATSESAPGSQPASKATAPRLVNSTSEPDITSDKSLNRARSIKRDDSKDRLSAIRGESPAKRPRTSSTPPSSPHESSVSKVSDQGNLNKRRRLEVDAKATNRDSRLSLSPDRRLISGSSGLSNEAVPSHKDKVLEPKNLSGKINAKQIDAHEMVQSMANAKKTSTEVNIGLKLNKDRIGETKEDSKVNPESVESRAMAEEKRATQEAAELVAKIKREEEEAHQRAEQTRLEQLAIEQLAREEAAKWERERLEEIKRQEETRREEARKAEEERKRIYDEQQRLQREEEERRRAAQREKQRAELRRLQQEKEAARLAKLPPLLRWFDSYPQPATREFAAEFRVMQGIRYDTIGPETPGRSDGREQWLLNTQVALLLGEKDLQLSRYTAWERIPVSELAKKTLWRVESERYTMITAGLRRYNQAFLDSVDTSIGKRVPFGAMEKLRAEALKSFLALDLFFVKVSDFMFIVPKFPHLRNLQLQVQYREIPPDSNWLDRLTFPAKWKQDPDADSNYGFAPGAKVYVNGELIHEDKPKLAQTSKTPFPEQRVPRIGFRQVLPNDPEYTALCIEQGLEHLLQGRGLAINGHSVSHNGQISITPPESTNGEVRRPSDDSPMTLPMVSHDFHNGIHDLLRETN